jgi:hypothetical protein
MLVSIYLVGSSALIGNVLEAVQSTTPQPVQTGVGLNTFNSVEGVQVLVQGDLEHGRRSLTARQEGRIASELVFAARVRAAGGRTEMR